MTPRIVSFAEGESVLDWRRLTEALSAGHRLPRAQITDSFLYRGRDTLLNRSAWIDGLGLAVKAATIFPDAPGPSVNGAVTLFSDHDGVLEAVIDFHLVTKWKTAGDSLLAALRLAPPEVSVITIVGAGAVAHALRQAYGACFPQARFLIWSRTPANAAALAARYHDTTATEDLPGAVQAGDIVTCATMATAPILKGAWLRPSQHIDLIGAYRPDMREADDDVLTRGRLFVDSADTTIPHIGELMDPIERGVLTPEDIVADYYDQDAFTRNAGDITVFKNGGGAHLDLMTARHILECLT